jgi:hypothetical protein
MPQHTERAAWAADEGGFVRERKEKLAFLLLFTRLFVPLHASMMVAAKVVATVIAYAKRNKAF